MPSTIPSGVLGTISPDNGSVGRASDAATLDTATAWLTMARRLQQPVSFGYPRTASTSLYRYQTVLVPPGTTHVQVSVQYAGGTSYTPTVDLEIPPGSGFGKHSVLASHQAAQASPAEIQEAGWGMTAWDEVQDTPADNTRAHLSVDTPGRNDDEWQMAVVRLYDSTDVFAWTCEPVYLSPADVP